RQAVTRAIADKARTIRIPVHMVEKLNKVVHVERALVQEMGREPSPEEIAKELEWTAREVKDIMRMSQLPVSLEKPIGEDEDSSLGDFVEDETAESPFELASENLRRQNVRKALEALPEREREVMEMRFGLDGHQARTLEEVGRAEVKTTCSRTPFNHWEARLCTRGGNQSWSGTTKHFDPRRCDFVFVHAGDGRRWFIPTVAIEATSAIVLGGPKYSEFEVERG